jgi:RHH-type rel operon transcriptional repressor/antitoxin RelB
MPDVITIRVDRKTRNRLEKLAKVMDRPKSDIAVEAIRSFIDLNEWQIDGIKAAIKEADAGKFASDRQVQAMLKKWKAGAR